MVPSKVIVCFFNLGSRCSLRKAIQASAVILIPSGIFHQPTNQPTIIPLIMIPPPLFWDLKRWWWPHPFMTPFLLPLSWPSRVAQDSTVNKSCINMMVPSKVTVCFFNLGSRCSLRKATQASAVILIASGIFHQPTNHNTPHHDTSSSFLGSQTLMMTSSILFQPSGPSRAAQDSSVIKTFEKSTFMLSSGLFKRFCTCIFINGGVVIGFTDVPAFFRRRHLVVQDTVVSLMRLKKISLVKPGLFTASCLIHFWKHWKTILEKHLSSLSRSFTGAAINVFAVW